MLIHWPQNYFPFMKSIALHVFIHGADVRRVCQVLIIENLAVVAKARCYIN